MKTKITVNLNSLFDKEAKIADLEAYVQKALELAGDGNEVVLTGAAPIWMYLKIAHALHGKAQKLYYSAPGQNIEELEIFTHNAF